MLVRVMRSLKNAFCSEGLVKVRGKAPLLVSPAFRGAEDWAGVT